MRISNTPVAAISEYLAGNQNQEVLWANTAQCIAAFYSKSLTTSHHHEDVEFYIVQQEENITFWKYANHVTLALLAVIDLVYMDCFLFAAIKNDGKRILQMDSVIFGVTNNAALQNITQQNVCIQTIC